MSKAAMIEIKRHGKYPGIIYLIRNNLLGIYIFPRKEDMDTTFPCCAGEAHLVSPGSIPCAKCAWGSYCSPYPYKRLKHAFEFPRLEQTVIVFSVKCIHSHLFHFWKESQDVKNNNKRFWQSQRAWRIMEMTQKSFRYWGKVDWMPEMALHISSCLILSLWGV